MKEPTKINLAFNNKENRMGMIDTIICEYTLPIPASAGGIVVPDKEWKTQEFQTKSLDNQLKTFFITADGELYEERSDTEWVEDSAQTCGGHFKTNYSWKEQRDYHGEIVFGYLFYGEEQDSYLEFKALFTKGNLSNIKFLSLNSLPNAHRKECDLRLHTWNLKCQQRQRQIWYKIYRFLWDAPVVCVFGNLRKWAQRLPVFLLNIESFLRWGLVKIK